METNLKINVSIIDYPGLHHFLVLLSRGQVPASVQGTWDWQWAMFRDFSRWGSIQNFQCRY